jgi:hypothetical protein
MQSGWRNRVALAAVLAARVVSGQTQQSPNPPGRIVVSTSADASIVANGEVVREIDDPHTGDRWLLVRDDRHPGGPGLLLLVAGPRPPSFHPEPEREAPPPVIRAGDRVVVEENSPVVEARLEAVAMNPAEAGAVFNLRLSLGGRIVRAVAIGPHRAVFEEEVRR